MEYKFVIEKPETLDLLAYQECHRKYWEYIANSGIAAKPIVMFRGPTCNMGIKNACFACEFAKAMYKASGILSTCEYASNMYNGGLCEFCPIKSYAKNGKECSPCCVNGEPYSEWTSMSCKLRYGDRHYEELYDLALKVANIEWYTPEEYSEILKGVVG